MSEPIFLVTGAAGFTGSHLVRHLAAQGIRVRAMVRRAEQAEALKGDGVEPVIADINDAESLPKAVDGIAGIYHIAALFRPEAVEEKAFYDVNVEGTRNLLDAAVAAGVPRFVHCSTNGVHSDIDNPPADETYPFKPADAYQKSKLEGELLAMEYFKNGRIGGVVIRPTMIWGPGDTRSGKLFKMIAKGSFFYVGPGEALTHWVDVRDLAEGFRLAMEKTDVNAEAFLIGGRRFHTLKENVQAIAAVLGKPEPKLHLPVAPVMALARVMELIFKPLGIDPPLYRRRVSFFLKNRAYTIEKAERMLGFQARQDMAGEVADIVAAYRASGELPLASNSTPQPVGASEKAQ